jgi:hypothetical protein
MVAYQNSRCPRALRSHHDASMETDGFRDAAFEPAWIEPRRWASVVTSNPATAEDGVIADGMAKPSLKALLGYAEPAGGSADTPNSPPLRFPFNALESISFIRTSWYFRRVGKSVREARGCGLARPLEMAAMTASRSSSESTGPFKVGSRSSSRSSGALASIAASIDKGHGQL